jgi:hypothetical protein
MYERCVELEMEKMGYVYLWHNYRYQLAQGPPTTSRQYLFTDLKIIELRGCLIPCDAFSGMMACHLPPFERVRTITLRLWFIERYGLYKYDQPPPGHI